MDKMDVDSNSQSDEEYEYMYSDDDEYSGADANDSGDDGSDDNNSNDGDGDSNDEDGNDGMDTASLEMEDANHGDKNDSAKKTKRKSRGRTSSIGDVMMRESNNGIHMMNCTEIIPMMQERISEITEVLNVPPSAAFPLLRNHKWTKERLYEAFTDNDANVQKETGVYYRCLAHNQNPQELKMQHKNSTKAKSNNLRICEICMDDELTPEEMTVMPCGHEFCTECWGGFIQSKIGDGPNCILTTCPQAGCKEIVTEEEVERVRPDLLDKYKQYQLRNFVDLNGTSRWCPGPGCERVAALNSSSGMFHDSDAITAVCDSCTTAFCIKCGEEPHLPLNCRALESWKEKCKNESETANWILANTKACPKCRTRIEKNQGCNHMTCQNCKYEFCWICSGDWKLHGANTGGYYNCNKFNEEKETDDQSDAAKAKRELDRYLHYYSRYHAHAEAQKFAKRQQLETEKRMVQLQETKFNSTWTDVEFLKTANEQLVECRRVLKFTYTFAYYLTMPPKASLSNNNSDDKSKKSKKDKKQEAEEANASEEPSKEQNMQKVRFEHHQEMLERFTENLSELVEKPLKEIDRVMVVNQTRVVDRFMKNMLQYVDDGMEEEDF